MAIAVRYAVPAVAILTACAAAAGARHLTQAPRDPCEAHPEIHACAMFRQPEWMARGVYAGRTAPSVQTPEPTILDTATVTGAILPRERVIAPAVDEIGPAEGI